MKSKKNIKSILMMAILGIVSLFFINMSLAANTAKVNVETANLREEANEKSKILELLSLNEEVEILEKDGDWYKVKAKGITGYLRQDLIKVGEEISENATENENNDESKDTSKENTTEEQTVETASNLVESNENKEIKLGKQKISEDTKLKIVPTINATDIIEVKKDEEVEVTEIINGWVCVETQVTKGWIRQEKIKKEEQEVSQEEQESQEEQQVQEETQTEQSANTVIKTLFVNSTTVNLRKEASTTSEVVTTLSVNTEVSVLEESNGWSKVKVNDKEGYISSSLLSTTKKETSRSAETPRATTQVEETSNEEASTTSSSSNSTGTGSSVVETAMSYIGCKYVYGGSTPSGFDCSGFTSYIYKQYGVSLNRTAAGQYSNGTAVSRSELQPGDLVMFGTSGISHVGIYIGGGMIVHAANPSRGVTTDTINSGYYYNNYVGARRVM